MTNGNVVDTTTAPSLPVPQSTQATSLGAELLGVGRAVVDRVVAETKARPRIALGIAVALGFVLGGGLWTRAGRVILLAGAEYAVRRMARSSV